MAGKKRQQMRCNPNGADAWSTTTVGDAEGLVQIQMTDISPKGARPAQPNLCIQIRSIELHLASVLMHERTDFANPNLKHSMG